MVVDVYSETIVKEIVVQWLGKIAIGLSAALAAYLVGVPALLAVALGAGALWLAETLGIISEAGDDERHNHLESHHGSTLRRVRLSKMRRRVRTGIVRATPIALGVVALGALHTVIRWMNPRPVASNPGVELVLTGGMAGVVFVSYFTMALAGYRVDGATSNAPRPLAWLIVTLALVGIMGPLIYFAARFCLQAKC